MTVLWLLAHPDPRSLSGVLAVEGQRLLRAEGHDVEVSDLYAMGWNPVVDAADYAHDPAERFHVGPASRAAYEGGRLSEDVLAEQEKVRRADAIVVQFPLWWFGLPAILKGWFDRVFVDGFAYGVRGPDGRTRRYGDGVLAGKRAMVVVSAGGPAPVFSGRGINGELGELLFPLLHGTLFYAGASVLPPLLVPGADRFTAEDGDLAAKELRERLRGLWATEPIPYRAQQGGDYTPDLVLRDDVAPGATGLGAHRA
ncbi:MAG: NAD(P)H-dependent oxidoreductase [Pseudonocardia sp.]|nr:NAD(P)H-dependent oxidoreductase [Pseudonocardia sp.]